MNQVLVYLHERFFAGSVKLVAELEEAQAGAEVAELVREMRAEAGLTQRQLAKLVGTGASVICRLENDEYRGAGMAMLRRVAWAVGKRIEIRIVERGPERQRPRASPGPF